MLHVELEWETSLTPHSLAFMLVLSIVFTLSAPVDRVTSFWVWTTLSIRACVNTFRHVNQRYLTSDTTHISLRNQFFVVLGWTMALRNLGFRELMSVGGVFSVALLAQREVVTLGAIESVCALLDWL